MRLERAKTCRRLADLRRPAGCQMTAVTYEAPCTSARYLREDCATDTGTGPVFALAWSSHTGEASRQSSLYVERVMEAFADEAVISGDRNRPSRRCCRHPHGWPWAASYQRTQTGSRCSVSAKTRLGTLSDWRRGDADPVTAHRISMYLPMCCIHTRPPSWRSSLETWQRTTARFESAGSRDTAATTLGPASAVQAA